MTEAQLKRFAPFQDLPIYDESDPRSDAITAPAKYRSIRECSTLGQVQDCFRDGRLVPLGALRCGTGNGAIVVAYFGER